MGDRRSRQRRSFGETVEVRRSVVGLITHTPSCRPNAALGCLGSVRSSREQSRAAALSLRPRSLLSFAFHEAHTPVVSIAMSPPLDRASAPRHQPKSPSRAARAPRPRDRGEARPSLDSPRVARLTARHASTLPAARPRARATLLHGRTRRDAGRASRRRGATCRAPRPPRGRARSAARSRARSRPRRRRRSTSSRRA